MYMRSDSVPFSALSSARLLEGHCVHKVNRHYSDR
jgi:hypothetical protein